MEMNEQTERNFLRQRLEDNERLVEEKDRALQQAQETIRVLQHVVQQTTQQSQEKDVLLQKTLKGERRARKGKQRMQKERDDAMQQAQEKIRGLQHARLSTLGGHSNRSQENRNTLSGVGMPPGISASDGTGLARATHGTRTEESNTQGQNKTTEITLQKSRERQRNRPYCSQHCLLGLVEGEPIDPTCPNVAFHCAGEDYEDSVTLRFHPVNYFKWLCLIRGQLLNENAFRTRFNFQGVVGDTGTVFKVIDWEYGYTFVAKAIISPHMILSERESRVYKRLKPIQGEHVPVYLGMADLPLGDVDEYGERVGGIWTDDGDHNLKQMILLSWAGVPLVREHRGQRGPALHAVHDLGVRHRGGQMGHVLYNTERNGIMLVDFETSYLCEDPGLPGQNNHNDEALEKTEAQLAIEENEDLCAAEEMGEMTNVMIGALKAVFA
ncbi:hypothetical protein E4U31_007987 [Claviceps sp. LM219 group G6]|nr:hypothetical protein E4U31_007987 [Claviceps sp. LM219 group G6]